MTNYDNNDKTVDIPDFVEDKGETSTSIDMSIFKMSDDELYDDVVADEDEEDETYEKKPRKKGGSVVLVILTILLALGLAASLVFMFKLKSDLDSKDVKIKQLEASIKTLNTDKENLQKTIDDMIAAKEAEEEAKKQSAVYVITYENGLRFRSGPGKKYDAVTYEGSEYAYPGDEFTVQEIVEDGSDKWAKFNDKYYFILEDSEGANAKLKAAD